VILIIKPDHQFTSCYEVPIPIQNAFQVAPPPLGIRGPRGNRIQPPSVDFLFRGQLLTGLVPLMQARAFQANIPIEIQDQRVWSTLPDRNVLDFISKVGFEKRSYQIEAVNALLRHGRGVWAACTAAGKTFMLAMAIYRLNLPTLVLTPAARKDVAIDISMDLISWGLPAEYWKGKFRDKRYEILYNSPESLVYVANAAQVLSKLKREYEKAKDWLSSFQFVALDECHEYSDGIHQIFSHIYAPYRLFMSGTPYTKDKVRRHYMIGSSGQVIYSAPLKKMMDEGYVAKISVLPFFVEHSRAEDWNGYHEAFADLVVDNSHRNQVIINLLRVLLSLGKVVLVTTPWKQHCLQLEGLIPLDLIPVTAVYTGDQSSRQRLEIRQAARESNIQIIIGNMPAETGISIPSISAIVVAGAGHAPCNVIQRVGRGVRQNVSKDKTLIVVDIQDIPGPAIPSSKQMLCGIAQQGIDRIVLYKSEGMKVLPDSASYEVLINRIKAVG